MNLWEILTERLDLTKQTPIHLGEKTFIPSGTLLSGETRQSKVYQTGQGVVTKVVDISQDDSIVYFTKITIQHQDNPFFPRIYHAGLYYDRQNPQHKVMVVQTEKLIPLNAEKLVDVIPSLFNSLGITISKEEYQKQASRFKKQTSGINKTLLTKMMVNKFDQIMSSKNAIEQMSKISQNQQFIEAARILNPWLKKFGSDLHPSNIMVRLTNVGPQLVIIDPFVSSNVTG